MLDTNHTSDEFSDEDETPTAAVPGGRSYSWRRPSEDVTAWWWSLPEETRSSLAALHPGDVLCPASTAALAAAGLRCPRVTTVVDGRRVARPVATAGLVRTLHLVRMTHSERRLA